MQSPLLISYEHPDLAKLPDFPSLSRSSSIASTQCGSGSGSAGATPIGLEGSPKQDEKSGHQDPLNKIDTALLLQTSWKHRVKGIPDMDYPAPLIVVRDAAGLPEQYNMCVRNTFWEMKDSAQGSLAEFWAERQIHSCPASRLGAAEQDGVSSMTSEAFLPTPATPACQEPCKTSEVGEHHQPHPALVQDVPQRAASQPICGAVQARGAVQSQVYVVPSQAPLTTFPWMPMFPYGAQRPGLVYSPANSPTTSLSIPRVAAPAVAPPQLQAPPFAEVSAPPPPMQAPSVACDLPKDSAKSDKVNIASIASVGSAGHDDGTCRPCAFIFKKGCESGALCTFCHLCPPGEKKRRAKERGSKKAEES
ncbi:unnamed protein product [Effrenium voratum]|uniref:C3H1-type domain-containing protein n=1 Tax=Effrenium voratum TaxID=2562239 RepID=A0AA36MSB8_9DINO|nr:unnamed protein product [Effrenium voratum]CAJ1421407.1 unnamed protein product [Effrenium voratum]